MGDIEHWYDDKGTVPAPPFGPCAQRDDNVVLVRRGIAFLGSRSGGGETPESVQLVISHFSRAGKKPAQRIFPIRVMRDRTELSDSNPNKIVFL